MLLSSARGGGGGGVIGIISFQQADQSGVKAVSETGPQPLEQGPPCAHPPHPPTPPPLGARSSGVPGSRMMH